MTLSRRHIVASVFVALAAMVFAGRVGAQTDPAVGTWKLNLAKSRYTSGPLPKSNTVTISAVPNGQHVMAKDEDPSGKLTSIDYTATADGKDIAVKGAPAYDTTAMKRIDASATEQMRKKDGKTVQTFTRKISADGKTMTFTTRGIDESGRTINNVAVYDKQ